MDHFKKHGEFPGIKVQRPRRLAPFLNWITWFTLITIPLMFGIFTVFLSQNLWLISASSVMIALVLLSMQLMIKESKAKRGSSYGKFSPPQSSSSSPSKSPRGSNGSDEATTLRKKASNGSLGRDGSNEVH